MVFCEDVNLTRADPGPNRFAAVSALLLVNFRADAPHAEQAIPRTIRASGPPEAFGIAGHVWCVCEGMNGFQREQIQERRAWSLINELHLIHRELVRLLDLVVQSPKTSEWTVLLGSHQEEDVRIAKKLTQLSLLMGRKPTVCDCPKAVELLADVLLAYRTLLRKHASGNLVIAALRSLRSYAMSLWSELAPILPAFPETDAARLVDELIERSNRLLEDLPPVELSRISTGGHRSYMP